MCWICSSEKFKLQKAEEDIVVYKVLKSVNGKLRSPNFDCFPWIEGETYGSPLDIHLTRMRKGYNFEGLAGMHSYKQEPRYDSSSKSFVFKSFYTSERCVPMQYSSIIGFHIVKCIIPKNTIYAVNDYNEIISERIQFIKLGKLVNDEITFDNVLDE